MKTSDHTLPQLTESQFTTFLLIYAGHVDYNYTEEKITFVKSQDKYDDYSEMYNLFNNMADYASLKVILKHKDFYYNTTAKKELMYNNIIKLFHVDGDYSRGEKTFLQFLDKMVKREA